VPKGFVAANLKELNRRSVYSLLRSQGEISKAEITRQSGISAPTVIKIVDYFAELGLLVEGGEGSSALGRKPQLLRYAPDAAYAVGAEYDGLHLHIGLVDLAGRTRRILRRRVESDLRALITRELAPAVEELLAQDGLARGSVKGLGLGLPGVVGPEPRGIRFAPFVGVEEPFDLGPLLAGLEAELGLPVAIENDANAAALGEYEARGLGESGDLLFLELGRGLGAGLILGGKLRKGPRAFAGELGYVVLEPGHQASLGEPGWLERRIDLGAFWEEAEREGRPSAASIRRVTSLVALALANLCVAADLDRVVVGTAGMEGFGGDVVAALEGELARLSVLPVRCEPPAAREPGISGAAGLAAERWLDGVFAG